MKIHQLALIIILSFACISCSSDQELGQKFADIGTSHLGVHATEPHLDQLMDMFMGPSVSVTGKSLLTVNKMGFDVLDHSKSKNNWLLDEFYNYTSKKKGVTLDIGCGYGNLVISALAAGNVVIANDIAAEHLIEVRRKAMSRKLSLDNLYLNSKSFPYQLNLPDASLDVVMIHRVLHFLSPVEIDEGIKKAYRWLKKNGRLFIVVMAPQNKSFADWFLPIYNRKWDQGDKWPGVDLSIERALPDQAYNLPKTLHVMDERPLRHVLEKHGFRVAKIDFIDMRHFGKANEHRDGREAMGVIAVKDSH